MDMLRSIKINVIFCVIAIDGKQLSNEKANLLSTFFDVGGIIGECTKKVKNVCTLQNVNSDNRPIVIF